MLMWWPGVSDFWSAAHKTLTLKSYGNSWNRHIWRMLVQLCTLQLFLLNTPEHSGCQIILNNAIYSKLSEGKMMISFIRMDFVVLNLNMI